MKIAVIGVGRMGRRHLQVAIELGLSIVGICDQNLEALKICEDEFHINKNQQFIEAKLMLETTQPDCVIIATTAPMHCDYTCLAAECGTKFILCEKPMAISLAQCDRMIQVCKKNDARLAINHQMRFMEQYITPKQILFSEAFGGLSSVAVIGGNFGLAMNGTHYFEMFRYLTDEKPFEVTAWFSEEKLPNPRGPLFEDRAGQVKITTAKGIRFYMDVSADQGHGVRVIYAGRRGQIVVDELNGSISISARNEFDRYFPTTRYGMASVDTEMTIKPADSIEPTKFVLDALIHEINYPTGEEGRLAIATLVAAYCSHEQNHKSIIIDNDLPVNREFPWA
jgi:predicted dehydrogenase